jgi:glycosyltransferase involved in cell wall biosynthesis
VIDDGSSDGTADVLKSFGDQITYIRQGNCGAHAAINRGILMSSGEYIAILDSDDAWLPNKLERQIHAFEQFPKAGLAYSKAYMINSEGDLINEGESLGRPIADSQHAFDGLLRDNSIPALTAMFRRVCVDEVGFFNESLKALSDWDLWIRISAKWPVIFIPESLAAYRVHESNAWQSLLKSGRVNKERLLLLDNAASALSGSRAERKKRREVINAILRDTALKTAYGHVYRRQYSEAKAYLLFALRRHPLLLKDALFALRLRFITKLLVGERGAEV